MRKIVSFLLIFILTLSLSAQMQRGLRGSYDVQDFPCVSFVWNSPNPDVLNTSQFSLYEKDSAVNFKLSVLPVDRSAVVNKSILILWEDMASHSRQSEFARELLTHFFSETDISERDRFEVAVFDRQKDTENKVIKPLVGRFSSDCYRLKEAVSNYQKNSRQYTTFPQQSDLYLAINEGINLLKKEPADRSGIIIVVTAGLNVKAAGASTEMETVRKNALEAGIPIYVIKYPLTGNAPEINMLAESTYGLSSSTTNISEALGNLRHQYRDMDDRLRGHDYRFTFTAKGERDGKPHPMRLMVDKVRQPLPPYIAPKMTFGMWIKENWWMALLAVLLIIGIVVLVIVLIKKKKKEREMANQAMQEQMRREQEESERRNRDALDAMRREHDDKERAAQEAAKRAQMAADEERYSRLMQTKNLFPRLQCRVGTETFNFTISKPRVTLGRDTDNDVAFTMKNASFNNQTVSGHHAEIVFNGSVFEVVNKSHSYTQGIIVNGQFYQQYTLRSGDMIGLGEAIITFYV